MAFMRQASRHAGCGFGFPCWVLGIVSTICMLTELWASVWKLSATIALFMLAPSRY